MADTFNDFIHTAIGHLRFRLESHNIPRFHLKIEASGETDDIGSTLLQFKLSKDDYSDTVRGNDIHAVTDEFVRRYGWQKKNNAELIPNRSRHDEAVIEAQFSEEVPF